MLRIAYLANLFPSPVEPYVMEEISELRKRGVQVVPCSARRPSDVLPAGLQQFARETMYLQPLHLPTVARALHLCWSQRRRLRSIVIRALRDSNESSWRRVKAVIHTLLGAYLAVLLKQAGVAHIHVHHGYFSSWLAMTAAQLLDITYTMTLHGSDILLHRAYLGSKLENCSAAFTVSEYNRRFLQEHYPGTAAKIVLRRLGASIPSRPVLGAPHPHSTFVLLTVGRLHPVKNHDFLVEACAGLKGGGLDLLCLIAGDGAERTRLQKKVNALGLTAEVKLLGRISHESVERLLDAADLFVLTSRSEGIPLALMEAMARGIPVLAPAIAGIPELVIDGETGFLYQEGSLERFVEQVEFIKQSFPRLGRMRAAARHHVAASFNRDTNLQAFANTLLHITPETRTPGHEDTVLQQIQFSLQRH